MAKARSARRGSVKVNKLAACLIALLIILIFTSVAATLMLTGVLDIGDGSGKGKINTLLDAQYACDADIEGEYGDKVRAAYPDDHSSRFDERRKQYLMFYELHMYDGGNKKNIKKFYVNCVVSPTKGRVTNLELLEHKEFKAKAVRRTTGNVFGL